MPAPGTTQRSSNLKVLLYSCRERPQAGASLLLRWQRRSRRELPAGYFHRVLLQARPGQKPGITAMSLASAPMITSPARRASEPTHRAGPVRSPFATRRAEAPPRSSLASIEDLRAQTARRGLSARTRRGPLQAGEWQALPVRSIECLPPG